MASRPMESYYPDARKCRVLVLEDLDFLWEEADLDEMASCWKRGMSVKSIAKRFKRDPDEILLALIHLARKDKIKQRESGLMGV